VVARGVGEAAYALVAPTIAVGMAQHHLRLRRLITLRPRRLIAVVRDNIVSLARTASAASISSTAMAATRDGECGLLEVYAETSMDSAGNRPGSKCRLRNWWRPRR
jgi:creatinine amidohydrolase